MFLIQQIYISIYLRVPQNVIGNSIGLRCPGRGFATADLTLLQLRDDVCPHLRYGYVCDCGGVFLLSVERLGHLNEQCVAWFW